MNFPVLSKSVTVKVKQSKGLKFILFLSFNSFKWYLSCLTVSFQEAKIIHGIGSKIPRMLKSRVIKFRNKKNKRCISKKQELSKICDTGKWQGKQLVKNYVYNLHYTFISNTPINQQFPFASCRSLLLRSLGCANEVHLRQLTQCNR